MPIHTPLTPITVTGPFNRIGIDVIKFPKSSKGNKYAVVVMDYLTKWPEVFPTRDQTSITIAQLLAEHIMPRHGVPGELVSDREAAFLWKKCIRYLEYVRPTPLLTTRKLMDSLSDLIAHLSTCWPRR